MRRNGRTTPLALNSHDEGEGARADRRRAGEVGRAGLQHRGGVFRREDRVGLDRKGAEDRCLRRHLEGEADGMVVDPVDRPDKIHGFGGQPYFPPAK
jgi:hypothetical protein